MALNCRYHSGERSRVRFLAPDVRAKLFDAGLLRQATELELRFLVITKQL